MYATNRTFLRIGIVQYDPKVTKIEDNIARVKGFLTKVQPGSLDLLCFPEMALTGYVFPTPADVSPYLEHPKTGVSLQFFQETARSLRTFVIAGYPEKLGDEEERDDHAVGANSAVVYDPNGAWIGGYRKTNLFEADLPWVKPGTGYACFPNLSESLQTVFIGHMYGSQSNAERYRLACSMRVGIFCTVSSFTGTRPPFLTTIQYWIARLLPLWSKDSDALRPMDEYPASDEHDETIVVICNRTGLERGSLFAGCSMVVRCSRSRGTWDIVGLVDSQFEGFRSWVIE
ncbi:hypothetical protein PIIN_05330 [Serendipita indica DSM 11827]|uniref:CN hydrolase domain-containing protein n=1 Tax=Serendipita indica (strain DSM 11827) TaxID=1109443 RepID=G4TJA3_SERID|nr:hypothetical protein PIIN_05330 [Serendipita indica DSM 11827]